MWIKIENPATERLYDEDVMDEPVSFNDNGTVQVDEELAERLIDHYDGIVEYEKE